MNSTSYLPCSVLTQLWNWGQQCITRFTTGRIAICSSLLLASKLFLYRTYLVKHGATLAMLTAVAVYRTGANGAKRQRTVSNRKQLSDSLIYSKHYALPGHINTVGDSDEEQHCFVGYSLKVHSGLHHFQATHQGNLKS